MASHRHGANAYLRGVNGSWTNARIQSRTRSKEFDNSDFALDELGRRVEAYQDDLTETLEVELIIKADFDELEPGAEVDVVIALGTPNTTKSYVVQSISDAEGNREWRKYNTTLVDWEYVDRS
jgi:hypothetical protein